MSRNPPKPGPRPDLALFLPTLAGGGAQRIALIVAAGLARRHYRVELLVGWPHGELAERLPADLLLVAFGRQRASACLPPLIHYLRHRQPACLLAVHERTALVALLARWLSRARTRVVVAQHGLLQSGTAVDWRSRAVRALLRWAFRAADALVAITDEIAAQLAALAGLPLSRITTLPNPFITSELFALADEEPQVVWFPADRPIVLGVGRLAVEKDFATLIQAFAQIAGRTPARLVILGEGPQRAELEGLVRQLHLEQRVCLPGWVPNPYMFMRRAAVLALSSAWDALPSVLVEALALGTPVVATACSASVRSLLREGQEGWLVPPRDAAALAAALLAALDATRVAPRRPSPDLRAYELDTALNGYERVLFPESPPRAT